MAIRTLILLIILCLAAGAAAAAPPRGPNDLTWVKSQAPLPGWKVLVPASGTSVLWYPPAMTAKKDDPYSVTAELRDKRNRVVLYLNAVPKTGNEQMAGCAAFRLSTCATRPTSRSARTQRPRDFRSTAARAAA